MPPASSAAAVALPFAADIDNAVVAHGSNEVAAQPDLGRLATRVTEVAISAEWNPASSRAIAVATTRFDVLEGGQSAGPPAQSGWAVQARAMLSGRRPCWRFRSPATTAGRRPWAIGRCPSG